MIDEHGKPLLYIEEVAKRAGVACSTVRTYNAEAHRRRLENTSTDFDLPEPFDRVKRIITKRDGKPVTVWTPVWREADIETWLGYKRGPRGKVILEGGNRPSPEGAK